MWATSVKLPPELKERVVAAAKVAGQSPHAFMLHAIEQQTALAEARAEFVREALVARDEMGEAGAGYDAAEAHAYLAARVRGAKKAPRPDPKPWRD